jgi:phosphatidylserine/phosphatidylglycerophosphate/cardiolipin synthase-like enzyme
VSGDQNQHFVDHKRNVGAIETNSPFKLSYVYSETTPTYALYEEAEELAYNDNNASLNEMESVASTNVENPKRWFLKTYTSGNRVDELIDGAETFKSMVQAMRTAVNSSHFIYFANWGINLTFELIPGDPTTTLWNLIRDAGKGKRGVEIRALISRHVTSDYRSHPSPATMKLLTLFNSLQNGSFIIDDNFLRYGSHHQKLLVVKGEQGLIGFCGGIDFASNRLHGPSAGSTGSGSGSGSGSGILGSQHDVHCRIEGPASWDLLKIFIQRWDDHGNKPKKSSLLGKGEPLPGAKGPVYVQIGRTFGNGKRWRGIENAKGNDYYSFAPDGEKTAWEIISHAIRQARRYIYLEDQYLFSIDAAKVLNAQLPKIGRLIILIPHSDLTSADVHYDSYNLRTNFVKALTGGIYPHPKISVCYRKLAKAHNYVHAKTWIIDDEFAIIGSANCNNRSYTHDSEVVAGIYDSGRFSITPFAKRLRMRLWQEHLQIPSMHLHDPVASALHWLNPPPSANIDVVPVADVNPPRDPQTFLHRRDVIAIPRLPISIVDPRGD